ncbi:hypothetical protein, conserved [Eimeria maxima]|uniref:Uncharacterized protein n=1 Tax=Eimeria maxima TaxID=5804 RepID=U6M4Y0_EIMMA|nr:hypothetical protein, conserved [Eimeria maxima]CDJ59292.1 hypothetical protein, conserved [Eimeria maxima]
MLHGVLTSPLLSFAAAACGCCCFSYGVFRRRDRQLQQKRVAAAAAAATAALATPGPAQQGPLSESQLQRLMKQCQVATPSSSNYKSSSNSSEGSSSDICSDLLHVAAAAAAAAAAVGSNSSSGPRGGVASRSSSDDSSSRTNSSSNSNSDSRNEYCIGLVESAAIVSDPQGPSRFLQKGKRGNKYLLLTYTCPYTPNNQEQQQEQQEHEQEDAEGHVSGHLKLYLPKAKHSKKVAAAPAATATAAGCSVRVGPIEDICCDVHAGDLLLFQLNPRRQLKPLILWSTHQTLDANPNTPSSNPQGAPEGAPQGTGAPEAFPDIVGAPRGAPNGKERKAAAVEMGAPNGSSEGRKGAPNNVCEGGGLKGTFGVWGEGSGGSGVPEFAVGASLMLLGALKISLRTVLKRV